MGGGDEFGGGARAEAGEVRGVVPRRKYLENAEAVPAVGDESEGAGGDHTNFYVVDVVELAFGGEELVKLWHVGFFYVNDGEALLPCRDVSVSAPDVDVAGVFEGNQRMADQFRQRKLGDVQNFQAVAIHDERVAELDRDAAGIVELWSADGRGDARGEWIVEGDDDESFVGEDVGKRSSDGDAARAGEDTARIECEGALQEIVSGIAVEERANAGTFRLEIGIANDDEAFFFIGDVKETVEQVNGLLLILRQLLSQRINAERGGGCNGEGIFRWNIKFLADRRNRRRGDFLGETLVVDVGDVVDAQTAGAEGRVRVFAARLDVKNIPRMLGGGAEFTIMLHKSLEIIGISDAMKVAAVDGFGLVMFGNNDGFKSTFAGGDINVAAHEIHEVGALQEKLGHPGVVVVLSGNMAIAALFCFFGAHGVRDKRRESLAGEPGRGNRLLRVIEPITVGVLRADQHGARRARGSDAMTGDRPIHAEHIDVIAKNLKVVAGVIFRDQAFIVQHGLARVSGHLQMAAEAGWRPRSMAGVAGHAAVGMRERRVVARHLQRNAAILVHEFRSKRLLAEVCAAGRDGVDRLNDLPFPVFFGHGALQ